MNSWADLRPRWRAAAPRALGALAAVLVVAEAFDGPSVTAGLCLALSGLLPLAALWPPIPRATAAAVAAITSIGVSVLTVLRPELRPEHTFGLVELAVLAWLAIRITAEWPVRPMLAVLPPLGLAIALLPLRLALEELSFKANLGVALGLGASVAVLLGLQLRGQLRRRADAARIARQAQRLEYARDLHDFVAHHVSAIVAQTKAARFATGTGRLVDAGGFDAVLADIEQAGTEAMASMRRMVGFLRDEAPPWQPPTPQTLGRLLAGLADGFPGSGAATADVDPALADQPLPAATLVPVHHVVQEALANVLRHAPDATRVEVAARQRGGAAEITVTDNGPASTAPPSTSGFGLHGLAERVAAVGGTLDARPQPTGGWRVTALIPLPHNDNSGP